jgi:hypothetical protein
MLHQALLLAQLPTGRQGSQVSSTMTRQLIICFKRIQMSGLWLQHQPPSWLIFLLRRAAVLVAVAILVAVVAVVQAAIEHLLAHLEQTHQPNLR